MIACGFARTMRARRSKPDRSGVIEVSQNRNTGAVIRSETGHYKVTKMKSFLALSHVAAVAGGLWAVPLAAQDGGAGSGHGQVEALRAEMARLADRVETLEAELAAAKGEPAAVPPAPAPPSGSPFPP